MMLLKFFEKSLDPVSNVLIEEEYWYRKFTKYETCFLKWIKITQPQTSPMLLFSSGLIDHVITILTT